MQTSKPKEIPFGRSPHPYLSALGRLPPAQLKKLYEVSAAHKSAGIKRFSKRVAPLGSTVGNTICHVAFYVLTDKGNLLVARRSELAPWQTMGGCSYPNALPRMINSLRLELMDEAAVLLTQENTLRLSPLYLLRGHTKSKVCVLLQVALLKDDLLTDLWSAERARCYGPLPADILQTPSKIKDTARIIKRMPLTRALRAVDRWRSCDRHSLETLANAKVFSNIADMSSPWPKNNHLTLLGPTTSSMRRIRRVCNHSAMNGFRDAALRPWSPIHWQSAYCLQSWEELTSTLQAMRKRQAEGAEAEELHVEPRDEDKGDVADQGDEQTHRQVQASRGQTSKETAGGGLAPEAQCQAKARPEPG